MSDPKDLSTFPPGWEQELRKVSCAIFGEWPDDGKTARRPGILERLRRIEMGVLVICILFAIRFTGVPTEKFWPILISFFSHGTVLVP